MGQITEQIVVMPVVFLLCLQTFKFFLTVRSNTAHDRVKWLKESFLHCVIFRATGLFHTKIKGWKFWLQAKENDHYNGVLEVL